MNFFVKEYAAIRSPITRAVDRVFSSGSLILGGEVDAFERGFAAYLGVSHVIGVGNGMEAIQIGLLASGIGKGDEVITTPLSAVATTLALTLVGAMPVFVDIDDSLLLDPKKVLHALSRRTKAILPVHLYGQPCDMKALKLIASSHNIQLIEDACQAHGATYNSRMVGSFGAFSAFSFYPTKNLGCYGDGGAIATNDAALADRCRMLRNYGQRDRYVHEYQGMNSRLDEVQAAILRVKLSRLDAWNAKRQKIAEMYATALHGLGDIVLPRQTTHGVSVYHQYVIRTQKRDALLAYLRARDIPALVHYPIPIHKQPCFPAFHRIHLPVVSRIVDEILSLPIHPYMRQQEVTTVVRAVKQFFAL